MSTVRGYIDENYMPVFVFSDGASEAARKFFRLNTPERESLCARKEGSHPAKHSPADYMKSSHTIPTSRWEYVYDDEGKVLLDSNGDPIKKIQEVQQWHRMYLKISKTRIGLGLHRTQYVDYETGEPKYKEDHEFAIDWVQEVCNDNIVW